MQKVIPTIIARDFTDFKKKIEILLEFTKFIQWDVMDGIFVSNKTFDDPKKIKNLRKDIFEVHLMVKNPSQNIEKWFKKPIKRIIFHLEAEQKPENLIKKIKQNKKEVGIALNPETPISKVEKYLSQINLCLLMAVNPGFGGQEFKKDTLLKIKNLRKIWPDGQIEIDGGINKKNAPLIIKAGADILAIGSAILKAKNPKKSFNYFLKLF